MTEPTERTETATGSTDAATDESVAVERVAELGAPADAVWEAVTDPELLGEWFGPVDIDLRPGGAITTSEPGEAHTIGVVEDVEPPRRIAFVWLAPGSGSPSSVELVIEDDDAGGSIVRTREVRLATDWARRPAWFASTTPRARASARA
jgi:uncharacterized protein YndB with AHSA1/START domain